MTMQISDTVIYNDAIYETGAYCADLLKPYLEKHHIELFADCSALWRGYYFFPNQSQVLADWYSGDLPIHNENTANRESNYLIFDIDKGHIIGQEQVTEQEYHNYPSYR